MASSKDRIYDELLSFLGDPIFQIPVRTFMDENCLIFDPLIDPAEEHKEIHSKYKKLIDTLLFDGFCRDMRITIDEAISGVNKLVQIPDLKEVFNALFEQVLAANDFNVFCQVMMKRNLMIQEQVLVMIIAATGGLPESLLGPEAVKAAAKAKKEAAASGKPIDFDKQEDELLRQVMEHKLLIPALSRSSKKEHDKNVAGKTKDAEDLSKTLELSKHEAVLLQGERKKMEENMKNLALDSTPPVGTATAAVVHATKKDPGPVRANHAVQMPPSLMVNEKPISGAQAASNWLASAQADTQSSTHSAIAASLSKLSPTELQKRQEYLRAQRDKLLAMKKDAREKQLGVETTNRPQRPQSARAARAAMAGEASDPKSIEEAKKLAMRKAIAEKLKQEVIGNQ